MESIFLYSVYSANKSGDIPRYPTWDIPRYPTWDIPRYSTWDIPRYPTWAFNSKKNYNNTWRWNILIVMHLQAYYCSNKKYCHITIFYKITCEGYTNDNVILKIFKTYYQYKNVKVEIAACKKVVTNHHD